MFTFTFRDTRADRTVVENEHLQNRAVILNLKCKDSVQDYTPATTHAARPRGLHKRSPAGRGRTARVEIASKGRSGGRKGLVLVQAPVQRTEPRRVARGQSRTCAMGAVALREAQKPARVRRGGGGAFPG